jgi:hypothetical protein
MECKIMGNEKKYELYDKDSVNRIVKMISVYRCYQVIKDQNTTDIITFYDTPDNLLSSSNVLLHIDNINNNSELVMEKDLEDNPKAKYIKLFQSTEFRKKIDNKTLPKNEIFFLSTNFSSLLDSTLNIDPDNIFKNVKQTLSINITNNNYKVVSGVGFKALLSFQEVTYQNTITKRENYNSFLSIKDMTDIKDNPYFDEFIVKLEKVCKCIFEVNESNYKMGLRLTKPLPPKDKKKKKTGPQSPDQPATT